jgi:predicted nucleic acid-binding protein
MRVFFDTNILVYTLDADTPRKRDLARAVVDEAIAGDSFVVSTQVLAEFYSTIIRGKLTRRERAVELVQLWGAHDTVPHTADLVLRGIALHQEHSLAFWDALIVQAALDASCDLLLTEDLQHGRRFGGLEVRNPFIAPEIHAPRAKAYVVKRPRSFRGRRPDARPT